jgi:hypothetical protein
MARAAPKRPFYSSVEIVRRIDNDEIVVRGRARQDAMKHFGYGDDAIISTIRNLTLADFHKTIVEPNHLPYPLDVYQVFLEDVSMTAYIKLGIDDRKRVVVRVVSFKNKEN